MIFTDIINLIGIFDLLEMKVDAINLRWEWNQLA